MKKAFETAIENGLNLNDLFPEEEKIDLSVTPITDVGLDNQTLQLFLDYYLDRTSYLTINIYALIFDTSLGFIESLIKERTCLKCGLKFVKEKNINGKKYIHCQVNEEWRYEYTPCDRYKLSYDAHYHRSLLANMTLEEMKDYINKLGEA